MVGRRGGYMGAEPEVYAQIGERVPSRINAALARGRIAVLTGIMGIGKTFTACQTLGEDSLYDVVRHHLMRFSYDPGRRVSPGDVDLDAVGDYLILDEAQHLTPGPVFHGLLGEAKARKAGVVVIFQSPVNARYYMDERDDFELIDLNDYWHQWLRGQRTGVGPSSGRSRP